MPSASVSLSVSLNVTAGHADAAILKHAEISPRYIAEISRREISTRRCRDNAGRDAAGRFYRHHRHAECPVVADDIVGDSCLGLCGVGWLMSYDRYSGAALYDDHKVNRARRTPRTTQCDDLGAISARSRRDLGAISARSRRDPH